MHNTKDILKNGEKASLNKVKLNRVIWRVGKIVGKFNRSKICYRSYARSSEQMAGNEVMYCECNYLI